MQKMIEPMGFTRIKRVAPIDAMTHGGRAKCLQRLIRLDMPVPPTVALSFDEVNAIASGNLPDLGKLLANFGENPLVSVRPSSQDPDWGGPQAMLNVGIGIFLRIMGMRMPMGPSVAIGATFWPEWFGDMGCYRPQFP